MKHLFIFVVFFSVSFSTISAQKIVDKLDHTYIDVIVSDETITEFISTSNDNCSQAIAKIYRNDSLITKNYLGSADDFLYERVDETWYVLSKLAIDDVVYSNIYNIFFSTEENTIESFTYYNLIEEEALNTDIKDFTVSNDTIYFLDYKKDSIVVVDLYGNKINEYPSPKNAEKISYYNQQFIIISKDTLHIYNEDMMPVYIVINDANYNDYRIIDNTLYFISDHNIAQLRNEDLDVIATLEEFSDFKIDGDTIYYIVKDDTSLNNIIYAQSLDTGDRSVVDEIKTPLKVSSFAKGRSSDMVFGYYETPSLRPIGVRCDLAEINNYGLQAGIEIIEVNHLEATPDSQAKTTVEFVITNYSFEDVKNYVYQTDTYGGVNCAKALFAEEIHTSLTTLSSDTIRREFYFNGIVDEFCINLLTINGRYDYFDSDNRDCKIFTSIDKIKSEENFLIYPNPAHNEIYIINEHDIVEIIIVDINGKSIITESNDFIDISDLTPGVYNVQLKTFAGEIIMRRFMKI